MAGKLGPKTPTARLGGIVEPQSNPVQLVAKVFTLRNPITNVTIRIHPLPMVAQKSFFETLLHELQSGTAGGTKFDKVLVEDGYLPYLQGTPEGDQALAQRNRFPYVVHRQVIPADMAEKYDGLVQRNSAESRIAHESVMSGERPLVDPRARRAVERADAYPEGSVVVMPWNVYHCLYIREKLLASGYEQVSVEDVVMVSYMQVVYVLMAAMFVSFWMTLMMMRLVGLM